MLYHHLCNSIDFNILVHPIPTSDSTEEMEQVCNHLSCSKKISYCWTQFLGIFPVQEDVIYYFYMEYSSYHIDDLWCPNFAKVHKIILYQFSLSPGSRVLNRASRDGRERNYFCIYKNARWLYRMNENRKIIEKSSEEENASLFTPSILLWKSFK